MGVEGVSVDVASVTATGCGVAGGFVKCVCVCELPNTCESDVFVS